MCTDLCRQAWNQGRRQERGLDPGAKLGNTHAAIVRNAKAVMKALKVIVAVVLLVALASGAYFVVSRQNTRDLHLAAATAAPIEGMPGQVGIFVQIENLDGPDRLIDVQSPAATRAWIDAPTAALAIPQNSTPALAADGAFVRLAGVSGDLTDGQIIPVTLTFEKAGQQSVQARLSAPKTTGVAHEFGLFGIGDVCRVGDGEPAPEIALTTRRDGDGWIVEVDAKDFEFTPGSGGRLTRRRNRAWASVSERFKTPASLRTVRPYWGAAPRHA